MDYNGIKLPEPKDGEMVLGAALMVKIMRPDGSITDREHTSETLHPVEVLGMATSFQDSLRALIMGNVRTPGSEPA